VEDNQQIQVIDLPRSSLPRRMQWSEDGQALTYINTVNGVSNIWSQPLAGGAPVQLTDFKSEEISNFAWSPDGSQLVCVRGVFSTDIVLLRNSK
jgi:Tol biopolymer transport system component